MKESESPKEKPEKETGSQPSEAAGEDAEQIRQQMLRIAADYQNYQKRTQRLIEQAGQLAEEKLMKEILPVLDNFEHALAKGGQSPEGDSCCRAYELFTTSSWRYCGGMVWSESRCRRGRDLIRPGTKRCCTKSMKSIPSIPWCGSWRRGIG